MRAHTVSPWFLLAAAALAFAGAGCRTKERPEPRSAAAHTLALRPPGGGAPVDERIRALQTHLRRGGGPPEVWLDLGEAWVVKARHDANPALYRSVEDAVLAAREAGTRFARGDRLLGLAMLDAHRFEEARALAAGLVSRDPGDTAALGILSDALLELGRRDEAAVAAQRMVDLKPNLPSYTRAAHLMWLRGDAEGALEAYRLAVDAGGEAEARAWARTQAALIHLARGARDLAEAELTAALAEAPGQAVARDALERLQGAAP